MARISPSASRTAWPSPCSSAPGTCSPATPCGAYPPVLPWSPSVPCSSRRPWHSADEVFLDSQVIRPRSDSPPLRTPRILRCMPTPIRVRSRTTTESAACFRSGSISARISKARSSFRRKATLQTRWKLPDALMFYLQRDGVWIDEIAREYPARERDRRCCLSQIPRKHFTRSPRFLGSRAVRELPVTDAGDVQKFMDLRVKGSSPERPPQPVSWPLFCLNKQDVRTGCSGIAEDDPSLSSSPKASPALS